jgi:hypothetical protein
MSEWIDVSVYAAMIASYWLFFAGAARAITLQMVADRNEDWLAANRERAAALVRGRWMLGSGWFRGSCYAWGAISLAGLLAVQLGVSPSSLSSLTAQDPRWEVLKDAHSTLLIIGLFYYLGMIILSKRLMHKDVPPAERRRASLTPRTIHDFVPRWFTTAVYGIVGVHLASWIVVGVLGLSSTPGFWARFAAPLSFSAVALLIIHASVTRRASDFLGVHDRRLGLRFAFGALIYAQIVFGLRLYNEVAAPPFEIDRVQHLVLTLGLVLALLALGVYMKNDPSEQKFELSPRRV